MRKFKKNKKMLLISGISLILVGGITFCINTKEKYKPQENSREFIAMFIQDENGEYSPNISKEFPKSGYELNLEKSTCKNGGILSQDSATKKISMRASHADQCTLYFDKTISSLKDFYNNVTKKSTVPDFTNPATTDETEDGLFAMADDYGTSYYFRGTAPNNYVKFGQDASGQDMWWRIIRFNGDGTVRMQYDGVGPARMNSYTRGFALTSQNWSSKEDAKHVGWMFGGIRASASTSREQAQRNETDSYIKAEVDEWFKKNIVNTEFENYVADRIFCNDRSTPGNSVTGWLEDTSLGFGKNNTGYGFMGRIRGNLNPQFTCPQENDKFTVEATSGGNGALTYPVGLITADEVIAAGSAKTANASYYLYKESEYWSMTPRDFHNGSTVVSAYVYTIYETGSFGGQYVSNYRGVAPVINLKAEYLDQFQGNGTINNPYIPS